MRLNHQDTGAGRPLIIMHGLFGSASNWKGIARRLASHCRVISVDLRNHGRSPWNDDVSYPAMADDIVELMGDLGLTDAILVGHSMGGKVAMTLALTEPRRVAALAVIDIAPVAYGHSHERLIDIMARVDLSRVRNRRDLDEQLAGDVADPALRLFLGQNLELRDGSYRWRINLSALAAGMDLLTGFPDPADATYDGPTVFVYGERSDYVAARHHDPIRRCFPDARLIGIAGAGHWVHAEQPGPIVDAILELIERAGT